MLSAPFAPAAKGRTPVCLLTVKPANSSSQVGAEGGERLGGSMQTGVGKQIGSRALASRAKTRAAASWVAPAGHTASPLKHS